MLFLTSFIDRISDFIKHSDSFIIYGVNKNSMHKILFLTIKIKKVQTNSLKYRLFKETKFAYNVQLQNISICPAFS